MKDKNNNRGEVMVEATFYFPLVLMILFFFIILGVVLLNQYIMNYEASRVADIAAMEIQYDGFDEFSDSTTPSMAAGLTELPPDSFYTEYYKSRQNSNSYLGVNNSISSCSGLLNDTADKYNLVGGFLSTSSTVTVDQGFTDIVTVSINYELKSPRFIQLIAGEELVISGGGMSSKVALRPTNAIRRYDAISSQINNYYGGNNWMPTKRYSYSEFDAMAAGGTK